jgi:hypothetical protein
VAAVSRVLFDSLQVRGRHHHQEVPALQSETA